jgi:DNA-binding GntR family transcriptional regulator
MPDRNGSAPTAVPGREPIARQTLSMLTLDAIRERILHGYFTEGAPLRQDALAAELGVSRIPVREALRQLEAEGLVTFSPHVGAVVSSLSLDEIRELSEIRALIESDLLRRAIPRIDDDDLARAEEILNRYGTAPEAATVVRWGELNWQFHSTLYAPANKPLSMGIVHNLHHHSERYFRMQVRLMRSETRATEEHQAILAAVARRDVEHATSLLIAHIVDWGAELLEFLQAHRARAAAPEE